MSPVFNYDMYSMWDSLDFGWIDLERKIIYKNRLLKILKKTYNKGWSGEIPKVWGYKSKIQ